MNRETKNPEIELAASGRAKARRGRPLIRYTLYATAGAAVLIAAAWIVSTFVLDAPLPESATAPPPELQDHIQEFAAAGSAPAFEKPNSVKPLAEAIGIADWPEFERPFKEAFYEPVRGSKVPVPKYPRIDSAIGGFVDVQRPLLERFYDFAERGGLLRGADGEKAHELMILAGADAELKWRNGNPEAAQRVAMALFRLIDANGHSFPAGTSRYLDGYSRLLAVALRRWAVSGRMAPETARDFLDPARRMTSAMFERMHDDRQYWMAYAEQRRFVVATLQLPWHTKYFGYDPGGVGLIVVGPVAFPKVGEFAAMTIDAIRDKHRAPELLAQWDQWNLDQIRRAASASPSESRSAIPPNAGPLAGFYSSSAATMKDEYLSSLVQCNLLRAGLTYIQDPSARPPATIDIANDPLNPWRDPYTVAPLRLIERDGRIAIYSPGQTGGDVNEQALSLENNDAVLLLPANPAPDGEASR